MGFRVQQAAIEKGIAKDFPLILTSGRLVEYEGGGEETRSNRWLAELQQEMFGEINPGDAAERGIRDGTWAWVTGAENSSQARVKALVTERVGKGVKIGRAAGRESVGQEGWISVGAGSITKKKKT